VAAVAGAAAGDGEAATGAFAAAATVGDASELETTTRCDAAGFSAAAVC
jgi:hypothetical protein